MNRSFVCPDAAAHVSGGAQHPGLTGTVEFRQRPDGVLVSAHISGLPQDNTDGFFAFHIHEMGDCARDGFPSTGGHYDPVGLPHPRHAGDLPPLLSCHGKAQLTVLTDRFRVRDVVGRSVVIHSSPDDLHSQPSGNPGSKIACGTIRPM